MKNKESFVVIPKYLFDELIEYFDNKSDADNGTPNKEMKLLSQLQEEHSLRESKGCELISAKYGLPNKSELYFVYCTHTDSEGNTMTMFPQISHFNYETKVWHVNSKTLTVTHWLTLLSESSNSTDELRKEIIRLKGLIEKEVRENISIEVHGDIEFAESTWQQFKETHNL